jgi:hypothetical protein
MDGGSALIRQTNAGGNASDARYGGTKGIANKLSSLK